MALSKICLVDGHATPVRRALIILGALALAASLDPVVSAATTITVTGGPGLDQGALCVTGQSCPSSPAFSLSGTDPLTGSFIYNAATETVSFDLTLTRNAMFGAETLLAGSSFSGSNVSVLATALGAGAEEISQSGSATGSATASFAPGLPVLANAPFISGLSCTIGTGGDQCGVSFGAAGLEVGPSGGTDYDAFLTFNTNVTPVPLPAAAWLMLSGLAGLATLRATRKV